MIDLLFLLSEADKRLIITFLMLFVLFFVLLSYLGLLVIRIMKYQGKKIETEVYDVVTTRVITDPKKFTSYARKKNLRIFYKTAQIPVIIMVSALLILLLRAIIYGNWTYNPFNAKDGFATLLFLFDFKAEGVITHVFGIPLIAKWPPLLPEIGTPQFVWNAWAAYIFVPAMSVGLVWYWITLQGFIARFLHIRKLKDSIFAKNLDNYNQNDHFANTITANDINRARQEIQDDNKNEQGL